MPPYRPPATNDDQKDGNHSNAIKTNTAPTANLCVPAGVSPTHKSQPNLGGESGPGESSAPVAGSHNQDARRRVPRAGLQLTQSLDELPLRAPRLLPGREPSLGVSPHASAGDCASEAQAPSTSEEVHARTASGTAGEPVHAGKGGSAEGSFSERLRARVAAAFRRGSRDSSRPQGLTQDESPAARGGARTAGTQRAQIEPLLVQSASDPDFFAGLQQD